MKTSQWRRHNGDQMIHVIDLAMTSQFHRQALRLLSAWSDWRGLNKLRIWRPLTLAIQILDLHTIWQGGAKNSTYITSLFRAGRKFIWIVSIGPWCASRHPPTMRAFTRLARLRQWCAHTLWSKDARTTWNARLRQWCDASTRLLGDKSCAVGAPEARIGPQGDRIGDRIGIVGAH